MSKKDYILIARVLRATRPVIKHGQEAMIQWKIDVYELAQKLQNDNQKFNQSSFYSAAGYTQQEHI